jgi:hypothetical protein
MSDVCCLLSQFLDVFCAVCVMRVLFVSGIVTNYRLCWKEHCKSWTKLICMFFAALG